MTLIGTPLWVAAALAIGILLGVVARGRNRPHRASHLVLLPLALLGAALRVVVELVDLPGGVGLLVIAYGCLIGFAVANLAIPGSSVLAFGLLLMVLPVIANGGMPVDPEAAEAAGRGEWTIDGAHLPGERHLVLPRDQLRPLGEIIPVGFSGQTTSFGELIALVGLADLAFNLTRRRPRRQRGAASGRLPLDGCDGGDPTTPATIRRPVPAGRVQPRAVEAAPTKRDR